MKRFTLSLLASIGIASLGYGQANITITAPPVNSSTQLRAPNGTSGQAGLKGCYIVPASELNSLTASVISSFGFSLTGGTGSIPVSGSFTLYLENTTNTTYSKGVNWPTILTGMQSVFVGNINVPATTNTAVITMPINFNYNTGQGLYVAFAWESAGPFSVNPATYAANSSLPVGGATIDSPTLPTPDGLLTSNFRPSFIFGAANTATNEISVVGIEAAGRLAKLLNNAQTPVAFVKNGSSITKTNIVVSLNVGGANSFSDTKTLATLAPGAVGSVVFNSFNSTVSGINNLSVTVAADQNPTNNLSTWAQSVTCTDAGFCPPLTAINFSASGYGYGAGAPDGGIYAFKYTPVSGGSVTAVRVAVPSFTQNIGKKLFAVLLDNNGNIVASGSSVTINAGNFNTFLNLPFTAPEDMQAGNDYYVGLRITAGNTYPIGVLATAIPITSFYTAPDAGGAPTQVNFGYLAIEGMFKHPVTTITASSSKALSCLGEPVTLTANGTASTYTWSANTTNTTNASNISVTPTNTGTIVYSVTGTDGPSGCKTNAATISQTVSTCTGINARATELSEIRIFPNPAVNGKSNITGLNGENTIMIYNVLGQVVANMKTADEKAIIDLSGQPSGTYLVKILDSGNGTRVVKIVNEN
ncbi:MAG: T9SS type A sorting domain-containing protein [Bacteroidota bacterium]